MTFPLFPRRPRPQPLAPGPRPSLSHQAWTQNSYMCSPLIVLNKITVTEDTDLQYIENVPVGFAHKRSRGPAVESEPMLNRCNRHSEKS